ncbi:hypothetical protein M378DRAFT_162155 [Amanita muscaria Koide BX008]|uniref:Uncharacterized protein n=1 Tax=Amanita muscaria (strain Koide BX008) TaxID=946122 RepID=A0A0C2X7E8_AMAMK|nr:hypothetical protein M378DRAFT_162155 [Amanita muscaria Koide BX008]
MPTCLSSRQQSSKNAGSTLQISKGIWTQFKKPEQIFLISRAYVCKQNFGTFFACQ